MRPITEIPGIFFEFEEDMSKPLPLMERYLATIEGHKPLQGFRLLLIQHQLSNNVAMLDALIRLGVDPDDIHWLDIPYTSHKDVQEHIKSNLGVNGKNLRDCSDDYRVLDAYAPYQHGRAVQTVLDMKKLPSAPLLVLDDGAYFLKALTTLRPDSWPRPMAIVEQTTRGIIKIRNSAAMRATARAVPIVDVASSTPKRTLEPPFVALAVSASLSRKIKPILNGRKRKQLSALTLGYGAIGEQVATYVTAQFGIKKSRAYVHEPNKSRRKLAARRGFQSWDPSDLSQRFDLVVGCSGSASFELGDREYLADGALLASASSGAIELSRREFVELARVHPEDHIKIRGDNLDESNLHSNIDIQFVDRTATFVNAGFPVNFDGRIATIPSRFIQQTPVMMVGAAVQAANAVAWDVTGVLDLDGIHCTWVDEHFRNLLGKDAHYLVPPPDEAW